MTSTQYAVPYSELGNARTQAQEDTAPDTIIPALSAWMSRALTAILGQADKVDAMGTQDGVATEAELRKAYDAGVFENDTNKYAVARLLDTPSAIEYLSKTPGADSANPGFVIADLKEADRKGEIFGQIQFDNNEITPDDIKVSEAMQTTIDAAHAVFGTGPATEAAPEQPAALADAAAAASREFKMPTASTPGTGPAPHDPYLFREITPITEAASAAIQDAIKMIEKATKTQADIVAQQG